MIKRADLISGILLLAFSIYYSWEATKLPAKSMNAMSFESGAPGPNFLPTWLGVVMIGLSVALIVAGSMRPFQPHSEEEELPGLTGWKRIGIILVAMVIYLQIMPIVGFTLSTFAIMLALMVTPDRHPVPLTFGVPVGTTLVLYFVFLQTLHVPMPTNVFGF